MGVLDSGGNVQLLWMFKDQNVNPYMQCLHFFFAFGSTVSPLIVGRVMDEFNDNFNYAYVLPPGDCKFFRFLDFFFGEFLRSGRISVYCRSRHGRVKKNHVMFLRRFVRIFWIFDAIFFFRPYA
jgi:hypothetical protein